jgi:hypothetical protein
MIFKAMKGERIYFFRLFYYFFSSKKATKMKKPTLKQCIIIDAIGMLSYLLPAYGETIDFLWAPISGIIFYLWFGKPLGAFLAIIDEILPFTDFIPTFTIAYLLKNKNNSNNKKEKTKIS